MGGMERVSRAPNLKFPPAKTLQEYNPAALLLDKHKKLKLTDVQQEQLKTLRLQIFERNAEVLARYDSLQREYKPPKGAGQSAGGDFGGEPGGRGGPPGGRPGGSAGSPPGGGRGGARGGGRGEGGEGAALDPMADSIRREAMRPVMRLRQYADSLEARRRADVRDVLGALTDPSQKKQAAEYLDKQDIEFSKQFPSLPSPRGVREQREPPGGPPPN
jgi:hypothetical protein